MWCLQSKMNQQASTPCCKISLLGLVIVTFDKTLVLQDEDGKQTGPIVSHVCHLVVV